MRSTGVGSGAGRCGCSATAVPPAGSPAAAWRGRRGRRSSSRKLPTLSCGLIPAILQKPPSGSALIPYSVSPRLVDQRVLPKPRKKRSTFMPNSLAVAKWPPSWNRMASIKAKTNNRTPTTLSIGSPGDGHVLDQFTGQHAGPLLGREHGGEIQLGGLLVGVQDAGDDLRDAGEGQPAGQEHAHRLDRKSTRLNSSHVKISYAVFCLKKKK